MQLFKTLKGSKNQGFTCYLKNAILEKPQGVKLNPPPPTFLGLIGKLVKQLLEKCSFFIAMQCFLITTLFVLDLTN